MSRQTKDVNQLFFEVLDDDSLLIEPDDSVAALKAFKRWRHRNTRRRNTYYDKAAQLYVFKQDGKKIVRLLEKAGFLMVEGISDCD